MASRLVKLLQKAHAGEIAAACAYEGHWRSVKDLSEKIKIQLIQIDEIKHQIEVLEFLNSLGARPSKIRDTVFTVIGKTLSVGCYFTGWFLPMWGALLIEQIGVVNYEELAIEAEKEGHKEMSDKLREMGKLEKEHETYFLEKLNAGKSTTDDAG